MTRPDTTEYLTRLRNKTFHITLLVADFNTTSSIPCVLPPSWVASSTEQTQAPRNKHTEYNATASRLPTNRVVKPYLAPLGSCIIHVEKVAKAGDKIAPRHGFLRSLPFFSKSLGCKPTIVPRFRTLDKFPGVVLWMQRLPRWPQRDVVLLPGPRVKHKVLPPSYARHGTNHIAM